MARGLQMAAEGADVLDVGGESTRPGALPVDEAEEMARVLPVISGLRKACRLPLSVDTRRAGVARAALAGGPPSSTTSRPWPIRPCGRS